MPKFTAKRSALATALVVAAATLTLTPAAQADSSAGQHIVAFSKVPSETKSVHADKDNAATVWMPWRDCHPHWGGVGLAD